MELDVQEEQPVIPRRKHVHVWRVTGILDRDAHALRECTACFAFEDEHPKVRDD